MGKAPKILTNDKYKYIKKYYILYLYKKFSTNF